MCPVGRSLTKMPQLPQPKKSIRCQCTGCGGRFEAPGDSAGKAVRCPKCKAAIRIPGGKAAEGVLNPEQSREHAGVEHDTQAGGATEQIFWFARNTDGQHHGPMRKADLDRMVANNQLDGLCQVRRADWADWRWIETVYVQFAETDAGTVPDDYVEPDGAVESDGAVEPDDVMKSVPPVAAKSRLQECPDCGKIVSRRATQCPNCGCPVALSNAGASCNRQPRDAFGRFRPMGVETSELHGSRRGRMGKAVFLIGVSCALLALLAGSGVIGWLLWQRANRPAEVLAPLLQPQPAPLAPVRPVPKAAEPASPEQVAAWINEVAAETAQRIDNGYRQLHMAQVGIQAMQAQADLLDSLVSGEFAKPASHDNKKPKPRPPPPYQSQYETLYQECAAYLWENISPVAAGRGEVVELARRWADAKRSPLQRALEDQIGVPVD